MQNRLYVGNLDRKVAATTLHALFEPHGFVRDVKLAQGAGQRAGFALVTMATDESATAAVRALNGASLCGGLISVKVARTEPSKAGFVMSVPKRTARREYHLKQRERIEASPLLAKKFPRLKALRVTLEYFNAAGTTRNGGMKCKLSVEHARSALWFACPGVDCMGGDFDLSEALAKAVARRSKAVKGEVHCQGTRKRGDRERVACQTLLRYKLILGYD
jgi:RNA recognition motif